VLPRQMLRYANFGLEMNLFTTELLNKSYWGIGFLRVD